jgi:hypothetical protein
MTTTSRISIKTAWLRKLSTDSQQKTTAQVNPGNIYTENHVRIRVYSSETAMIAQVSFKNLRGFA